MDCRRDGDDVLASHPPTKRLCMYIYIHMICWKEHEANGGGQGSGGNECAKKRINGHINRLE